MTERIQPLDMLPQILALMACVLGTWPFILAYAFGDWKPDGRLLVRRVGHLGIFILVTVITSQSQTGPAWAQQQAEDLRSLSRDVGRLQTDIRLATRDIGAMERGLQETALALKEDLADHESRLREMEASVTRAYAVGSVMMFVAPAVFQLILWAIQAFRKNGHSTGAHKS